MRRLSPKENPGTTDVTGRLGEQRSMPGSIGDRHYNRERFLAGPVTHCPDCAGWFFWRQRDSDAPWLCWGCEPAADGWSLVAIEIQNRHEARLSSRPHSPS